MRAGEVVEGSYGGSWEVVEERIWVTYGCRKGLASLECRRWISRAHKKDMPDHNSTVSLLLAQTW